MNELKKIIKILMEFDMGVYSGSIPIFKKKISIIDHGSKSKPIVLKF